MHHFLTMIVLLYCGIIAQAVEEERFSERGFYVSTNLLVDSNLKKLNSLAERAAKVGYNTVYFADWKFGQPWKFGKKYEANVKEAARIFRTHGISVVVCVTGLGDPCNYLNEIPDEVEALPVVNEPYKIVKGKFTPENILINGSFEDGIKHWRPDVFGEALKISDETASNGSKSLHFSIRNKESLQKGMLRVWKEVHCKPFQQYRLSFKLKTQNLVSKKQNFGINVVPVTKAPEQPDGFRYLSYRNLAVRNKIAATQDWKEYCIIFNTLEYSEITLALGTWGTESGEFWIDDIQLKPAAFLNVVRRADTPVSVTSADGKRTYCEGKDYTRIADPFSGNFRWKGDFDDTHAPPQISITPNSTIKEGEVVLASYYHPAFALKSAGICLNSPKLRPLIKRQIQWLEQAIHPDGYNIGIDEQRVYGYDPACIKSGINCGQALNQLARFSYDCIRSIAPGRKIYMWNDMFDPYANCYAKKYYYLVKGIGSLTDSWVGLPKDIIILRWTTSTPERFRGSMEHFQRIGMKYIQFPGYFDDKTFNPQAEERMRQTMNDPACIGVGFAQWSGLDNNHHLEAFLDMVRKLPNKTTSR